jgi:hypothetical protein
MTTKKLTTEESKALLDSLFALPNKVAKVKKATVRATATVRAKVKEHSAAGERATPIQRNRNFKPTICIIEVVHQVCTTCGSEHSFVQSRRVRFEGKNSGDLHTAYEVETVVPEKLPRQVDNTYSTTEVCPTCITLSRNIDDFLSIQQPYVQMELFHG